jgi:ferric-dicitrate binding protein FerR (iron transport regulator)
MHQAIDRERPIRRETTMAGDYLWDRSGDADPDVARLEELLSPLGHREPLDELRLRRHRRRWPVIVGALVAAAAAIALVAWWRSGTPGAGCEGGAGFAFTATGGTVECGGAAIAQGVLPVGVVLDTRSSEADLAIADIGTARLGARTRVRLEHTSGQRHELFLEQGSMHARVTAPPRIFAVATPSTKIVDLGCEYRLDVDRAGAGQIEVISGKVELEAGADVFVVAPARSSARLLPGRRAGLPVAVTAGSDLLGAVRAFEDGSSGNAIARILASATPGDAITIANLAQVVRPTDRRVVLERLAELVPAPQATTVDEALGDRALFEMWFDEVMDVHAGVSQLPQKTP